MPSTSRAQQSLFAIAEHHPEKLKPENRHLAYGPKALSHKELHDFAATPRHDLPVRKREEFGGGGNRGPVD